jgi:hypothetical protein
MPRDARDGTRIAYEAEGGATPLRPDDGARAIGAGSG